MPTVLDLHSCSLVPLTCSEAPWSSVTASSDGSWKASSFYLDSGRSSVKLPLRLQCPSKEFLKRLVDATCFVGVVDTTGAEVASVRSEERHDERTAHFGLEAKVTLTFGTGEAISATVEDVAIHSATVSDDFVDLEAGIMVRVSRADGERFVAYRSSRVKTTLEVGCFLVQPRTQSIQSSLAAIGLDAVTLGGNCPESRSVRLHRTRINPFTIMVELTHAFSVSVQSVPGPVLGQTLATLTMRHSNTHSQPVSITNIALHPGHSMERLPKPLATVTESSQSPPVAVSDMSKAVRWMYASQCDPKLPLTLHPGDAVCTIIEIEAQDDRRTRSFVSPLSVTATVGGSGGGAGGGSSIAAVHQGFSIVAASEVQWTSSRLPLEPTDAFRVDLAIEQKHDKSHVEVGSTFCVDLDITNLSAESRDVMVIVDGSSSDPASTKPVKTAIVSEKDGQKFGVWGLDEASGEDPVTGTEAELLAVDVALLLGELRGSSSKKAQLRFIALKDGTLTIPRLRLMDRRRGKLYDAPHNLRVVVQSG